MRINHNIAALRGLTQLNQTNEKLSKALMRLSTGKKINSAADNAAGLAISKKMFSQIKGLEQANRNSMDGISLLQTAEGALTEIQSMVQRMRELAVQAGNETNQLEDRKVIQDEINELVKEVDRIAKETDFNGKELLSGKISRITSCGRENAAGEVEDYSAIKDGYSNSESNIKTNSNVEPGRYTFSFLKSSTSILCTESHLEDKLAGKTVEIDQANKTVTFKDNAGFEMQVDLTNATTNKVVIDVFDAGSLKIQVGEAEGKEIEMFIPSVTSEALDLDKLDYTTTTGASDAIQKTDAAISKISQIRSKIGAYSNRFDHAVSNLGISIENMTAALSRIEDTDIAEEMSNYTHLNILQQSGTAMLAQANQRPQSLLQLLQG